MSIWLHIVQGNVPGRPLGGRVRDDLQVARDVPVAVDGMFVFSGDDIDADVVRLAVGETRYKRCEVNEVGRKVQGTIRCYRSASQLFIGIYAETYCTHRHAEGAIPPVKITAYL